jgi:hypothetical protein
MEYARLANSRSSVTAFASTGDVLISRGGTLDQYSQAINDGVRIAFMYGDRDYTCNCKVVEFDTQAINGTPSDRSWQGSAARISL